MSLYDQYYSNINKEYMFTMIKEIINKKKEYDISLDTKNYPYFLSSMIKIFNENDVEELEEINKILLDHNIEYFLNKIENEQPFHDTNNSMNLTKNAMDERLNEYISQRDQITLHDNEEKPFKDNEENSFKDNETSIESLNSQLLTIPSTNGLMKEFNDDTSTPSTHVTIKECNSSTKSNEKNIEIINEDICQDDTIYHINSSNRTNINSSRFNYKVDLIKQDIPCHSLKKISKLIIPIEDLYLFSIPVLVINIPELDTTLHMQQEEVIHGLHRDYGVYKPIGIHNLLENNSERITIDIRDISEKKYIFSDILKVNIIETKHNKIYFTCSEINKYDYLIGDYIKIINNNTFFLLNILQVPLKIKKIQENIIICEYSGLNELEKNKYTNIDMKIMNMSNQNILYFN